MSRVGEVVCLIVLFRIEIVTVGTSSLDRIPLITSRLTKEYPPFARIICQKLGALPMNYALSLI